MNWWQLELLVCCVAFLQHGPASLGSVAQHMRVRLTTEDDDLAVERFASLLLLNIFK